MSLVAGQPVMIDGEVVGESGTLLVTEAGVDAARSGGVEHEVVDPSNAAMYALAAG
jgi:hypothetical protein